jgi:hypothetical protein
MSWLSRNTPHEGGGIAMKHPLNRAERRQERQRIINYRRFVRVNGYSRWPEQAWSAYSKWNGNCGSPLCHASKYFTEKRRRREALKSAGADQIDS